LPAASEGEAGKKIKDLMVSLSNHEVERVEAWECPPTSFQTLAMRFSGNRALLKE
jgi:hypothetical protein